MRRMREHMADQRHDRTQCGLAADAVCSQVHLDEKGNRDHRPDSPTNRRKNNVLEAERREKLPRAITKRQAIHAPANFSAAARPRPPART